MVTVFRTIYFCAIALSFSSAVLVTASISIQDRAPQSFEYLGVSLAVTDIFWTLGVLLYGIQRHVAAAAVEASRAIRQAEVGAARTMVERTQDRFGLWPERLAADSAYGSSGDGVRDRFDVG